MISLKNMRISYDFLFKMHDFVLEKTKGCQAHWDPLAPYPNGWTLAIKALSFFGGGAEEAAGSWQHFFGDFLGTPAVEKFLCFSC